MDYWPYVFTSSSFKEETGVRIWKCLCCCVQCWSESSQEGTEKQAWEQTVPLELTEEHQKLLGCGSASWAQASDHIKTLWFLHFTCQEIDSQILKITASFSDVSSLWYFLTYSLIFPLFHAFWRTRCIESLNISRSGSALRWMSLLTCIKYLINRNVNMQKLQQILSLCRTINTISLAKIHFQSSFISSLLTQNVRGTDYQTNGVPFR